MARKLFRRNRQFGVAKAADCHYLPVLILETRMCPGWKFGKSRPRRAASGSAGPNR